MEQEVENKERAEMAEEAYKMIAKANNDPNYPISETLLAVYFNFLFN